MKMQGPAIYGSNTSRDLLGSHLLAVGREGDEALSRLEPPGEDHQQGPDLPLPHRMHRMWSQVYRLADVNGNC